MTWQSHHIRLFATTCHQQLLCSSWRRTSCNLLSSRPPLHSRTSASSKLFQWALHGGVGRRNSLLWIENTLKTVCGSKWRLMQRRKLVVILPRRGWFETKKHHNLVSSSFESSIKVILLQVGDVQRGNRRMSDLWHGPAHSGGPHGVHGEFKVEVVESTNL